MTNLDLQIIFVPCYLSQDIYTKPSECVDITTVHHEVFTAGALEARVHRTSAFRAPAGKPSDVRWIMSTHEGSFVFIIHPTRGILSFIAYYNYQDQTLYNICDYCWHCCNSLSSTVQDSRSFLMFKVNFQLVKSKGEDKPGKCNIFVQQLTGSVFLLHTVMTQLEWTP